MSSLQCFITILYLDGKVVLSRQRPSLVPRKMSSSTETNLTEGSGVSWWKICVQLRISVAFLFHLVKLHRLWDLKGFHILHVLARLPLYSPPWRCEHNKAVLSHPWNRMYLERSHIGAQVFFRLFWWDFRWFTFFFTFFGDFSSDEFCNSLHSSPFLVTFMSPFLSLWYFPFFLPFLAIFSVTFSATLQIHH